MSKFEQVHELRRRLLKATYDEAGGIPNHPVMLWKVAERMEGSDTGDPEYVNNLSNAAQVLGAQSKLRRQTSDWGAFSLTADGIAAAPPDLWYPCSYTSQYAGTIS